MAGMDAEQIRELLGAVLSVAGERARLNVVPEPEALPDPPAEVSTLRVRVDLHGARPPIWRRLELAGDLHLDAVHRVLQVAMGWTDSHLHAFTTGSDPHDPAGTRFVTAFDLEEGDEGIEETEVRLDQVLMAVGDTLFYEYDFGDGWEHRIVLEGVLGRADDDPRARCVQGRRSCPLEDVGGVHTWNDVVRVLAGTVPVEDLDPEFQDWLPDDLDPADFDLDAVNARLPFAVLGDDGSLEGLTLAQPVVDLLRSLGPDVRPYVEDLVVGAGLDQPQALDPAAAAAMVHQYSWLVQRVGDTGITLTAAGYLPPAVVSETSQALDLDTEWIGRGNRELDTMPVLILRESAQRLGLLRKHHGRLLLTAAGRAARADPVRLRRHLAQRLPIGDEASRIAGVVTMLVLCGGAARAADVSGAVRTVLGSLGWQTSSGPLQANDAWRLAGPTLEVLDRLGIDVRPRFGHLDDEAADLSPDAVAFLRAALRGDDQATGSPRAGSPG